MEKIEIGAKVFLYPLPTTLVGANVGEKPTYLTIGFCGAMSLDPPVIYVGLNRARYTTPGIMANKTFSVNLPSADMVNSTDYCGLVSGHKEDKSKLFKTFYGKLKTAPMIHECPLNIECELIQTFDVGRNKIFVGEVAAAYSAEKYLTEGQPDIQKINPILYALHSRNYWAVGRYLGQAFDVGKEIRDARGVKKETKKPGK